MVKIDSLFWFITSDINSTLILILFYNNYVDLFLIFINNEFQMIKS
jgi:hypothetical protein